MNPTQLNHKDIKGVRLQLLTEQENICPLCNTLIALEDAVLDHDHETGLVRGVLHSTCNSYEGMVKHKFVRSGVHKNTDIVTYLKNLIVYLQKEQYPLIHPNEKPKEPKLMRSNFNKLVRTMKASGYKKKLPTYPKSHKMTKKLKELYEEFNVEPSYYSPKGKRGK